MLKLKLQVLVKSNYYLIILIIFLNVFISEAQSDNEIVSVNTKSGQINGRKHKVGNCKQVNVFLGIPYAEPPIGDLRFRKPVPIKKWKQPIDANNWPNPCHQILLGFKFRNYNFSEDCLYLNIWSPKKTVKVAENGLKPVLFYIHGGGYAFGSPSLVFDDGFKLSSKGDVVVVTVGYRLEAFGFMYTGSDDAPGNMGLWDQSLALKWINNNIESFGGDPNRITISGWSAGSWSVSLHLLSPITQNLFLNAIMMSGAALNHPNDRDLNFFKKSWFKGAQNIGCTDNENSPYIEFTPKIMNCLRKADPELILKIASIPELSEPIPGWFRLVVIDGVFLPKKPLDLLKTGHYKKNVNLLIGGVEEDGCIRQVLFFNQTIYSATNPPNYTYVEAYEELKDLSESLPSNIPIDGNQVSKLYYTGLSDENGFDVLRYTICLALGDFYITCPTIRFAELLFSYDRKRSNVYQYEYTNAMVNAFCAKWMGSCHGSDVLALFGTHFANPENPSLFEKFSEQMIGLFSHFARHGYPNKQNGIDFPAYYLIDDNVIKPYLNISGIPKPINKFGIGLKTTECVYLWGKYINN